MTDPRGTAAPGVSRVQPEDPAFLAWARARGKPINRLTPGIEVGELLAHYEYEVRERRRRADESARQQTGRRFDRQTDWAAFQPRRTADDEDRRLAAKIQSGWERGDTALASLARRDVSNAVPLKVFLYSSHGADDDKDRWTYLRSYLSAFHTTWGSGPPGEGQLLRDVLKQEKLYLAEMKRRAAELAKARRPALQLEALRAWARKQPMNPADNFHPGVAYYDENAAMANPDWVDRDIARISQNDYTTTISYTRGKALSFPAKSLNFTRKYIDAIRDCFFRRHKASGRLVPFVRYRHDVDLYIDLPDISALSSDDRVLLALPYMMTPAVAGFYGQDPFAEIAGGLLQVLGIMATRKSVPMAAPIVAGTFGLAARVGTGGFMLGRTAVAEVAFAVRQYGVVQGSAYVGRSTYAYYLTHAAAINQAVALGAEIPFVLTGQDAGPGPGPGDVLSMAVVDDAARAGIRGWRAIEAEVIVDEATAVTRMRVNRISPITAEVAEAEYQAGLKVMGRTKGASPAARGVDASGVTRSSPGSLPAKGKGKAVIPPDPRVRIPTREVEDAMKKVVQGLGRLGGKFSEKALATLRGIDADAIRESGIRPSDFAKLANSLAHAGPTTKTFIERFHDAPGFEQVILNWAKRHFWNSRLAKPAWSNRTEAFYRGTSFLMKYAVSKLDPQTVRFEWPVSINTTRWGAEVPARFVDVVVTGGTLAKPGDLIRIELKSWTESVLRSKTSFSPGHATDRPGAVGYQLLRDTALFQPTNIRWVFDGSKLGERDVAAAKKLVIERFQKVIQGDDYLRVQWGGRDADPTKIRELLDNVIDVL